MVGHQEKQRLIQAYADEPLCATVVIAKSSVWLVLIAGLAAFGIAGNPEDGTVQAQNATMSVTQAGTQ